MLFKWIILFILNCGNCLNLESVWRWECRKGFCVKLPIDNNTSNAMSLTVCKLICSKEASLWPAPTECIKMDTAVCQIGLSSINHKINCGEHCKSVEIITNKAMQRFRNQIKNKIPKYLKLSEIGVPLNIYFEIKNKSLEMPLYVNESYYLKISKEDEGDVSANIQAQTYFGARHGLETLSQLIVVDDINEELKIACNFSVNDGPVYPYRGLMIDTVKSYYSVKAIKRTIDAMATTKLNTFHWHISGPQSFPFEATTFNQFHLTGAFKPHLIYTVLDIRKIVRFALVRGVRVLPEFDAPGNVGEGWLDFGVMARCKQPKAKDCKDPPCWVLDPTNPFMYVLLDYIYKDLFAAFKSTIFHMGGSEVSINCWKEDKNITKWMHENRFYKRKASFYTLWAFFQTIAVKKIHKIAGKIPIILWSSSLTKEPYLNEYLPKSSYIIQVRNGINNEPVQKLLQKEYHVIISDQDTLDLDSGIGDWNSNLKKTGSKFLACQRIYESSLQKNNNHNHFILGGEATLWSKYSGENVLDLRLWPRVAALGERLWKEPKNKWSEARDRLSTHRDRLLQQGIKADCILPLWCIQNEGQCGNKNRLLQHRVKADCLQSLWCIQNEGQCDDNKNATLEKRKKNAASTSWSSFTIIKMIMIVIAYLLLS